MSRLLFDIFAALDQDSIHYCLLRDAEQLDWVAEHGGELDVLIHGSQLGQLRRRLAELGFVYMHRWGHHPHHFFYAYDAAGDSWLKLDVVTEVAYGKPDHPWRTSLGLNCLSNRRRHGPVFIAAPEDELVTLLLHCVLDKAAFTAERRQRLHSLRDQVEAVKYVSRLLAEFWSPAMTWEQLARLLDEEQWSALLVERRAVAAHLARRDRLGTLARRTRYPLLRRLDRPRRVLRPQLPTVALLAPDGAGKSTLNTALQRCFYFPVHSVYMGLYPKGQARSRRSSLPGLGFARRLATQWRRYLSARYHQGCGRLVIFDRYTYDALLPAARPQSLGQRWRRWLLAHACPAPDLVFVLDAPGEVLYARKGEHSPSHLERQRQAYLALQPHLPQMVVIDATREPECVRREVTAQIWDACRRRQA